MCKALNPKYTPPTRSYLSDTLIPSWYDVEKANVISELKDVPKLAITSDGWTSLCQDHYLNVTVHYTSQGSVKQKVLHTRAVYQSQTGEVVAKEISDILEEFEIEPSKIVAVTVDNAGNMDVAIKKLQILKIGCFAHTLNLAAQKIYKIASIDKWAARIRAMVVWFKRSSMSKTVLMEKQQLLGIPQHSLILDVKTRWNSLYLMIERFMEQYPAIQAAALDPQLRKAITKDSLDRLKDEDFHKAEEFVQLMRVLYTSTLCVSCEKNATCGQIIPILQKLEEHFTMKDEDTMFVASIKEKDDDIQAFLHEATAMDPRFNGRSVSDERLRRKAIEANVRPTIGLSDEMTDTEHQEKEESEGEGEKMEETIPPLHIKRSALEELFSKEDRELRLRIQKDTLSLTLSERVDLEVERYKNLPPIPTAEDPVMWWWEKRADLPLLTTITSYLCAQASSTPSERVFSTAGNTISQERSRLLPEKANVLIFLQKNG
ncbi:zinc finger BED domain-containing protein 1-like [Sinocyclocheilus grahami]|uniref:zinc finger BED domain-containing protein 1-like n=1 Tax=Sinocyclocheilus grahami TaxID=75366 RepID=UPI0007AD09CC|nr:PREDICTED: zinc finger BED domain-containing protein 1-like [Sinocyclocheilus grahami]